jgi:hypothetical protein
VTAEHLSAGVLAAAVLWLVLWVLAKLDDRLTWRSYQRWRRTIERKDPT